MKIRLKIEPNEDLDQKGDKLIKALIDSCQKTAPEFAERLSKALPEKEITLQYKVLQDISGQVEQAYAKMTKDMVSAIVKVLDRSKKTTSGLLNPKGELKKGDEFTDITAPIREDADEIYRKVRTLIMKRGYRPADFLEGGRFYGQSSNELLSFLAEESM